MVGTVTGSNMDSRLRGNDDNNRFRSNIMSKILVIAEHLNGELNAGLAKVMNCANAIGGDVDVAVLADSAGDIAAAAATVCLLYTSPSPRDLSTSRMPSSA